MNFFKKPKDNSYKKLLFLTLILLIVIGLAFLMQFLENVLTSDAQRIVINTNVKDL